MTSLDVDLHGVGLRFLEARPPTSYKVGVRSRDIDLEPAWIGSVIRGTPPVVGTLPTRRAAAGVALRLLAPADGYDVLR